MANKNKKTLDDLLRAKRHKEEILAKLCQQRNEATQQRKERADEWRAALAADDLDKAMDLSRANQELDTYIYNLNQRIQMVDEDVYVTDAEAIEAANNETNDLAKKMIELKQTFYKTANSLCIIVHDMAEAYQTMNQRRNQCLVFHSAYGNGPTSEERYVKEGLNPLPEMPDITGIHGLLHKQFGDEANYIISSANGTIIG